MSHADFAAVFRPGTRFRERTITSRIEVEPTGTVKTTGLITLFDPVRDEDGGAAREAFADVVDAGTFPLETAFARSVEHPDSRPIAAIRARLGPGPAVRWESAALLGEVDPRPWGEPPGLRTRSGLAALAGADSSTLWCEWSEQPWRVLENRAGAAMVVFCVDEGRVTGWWGFDASGRRCELCLDTGLLTEARWTDVFFWLPLSGPDVDAANRVFQEGGVKASVVGPRVLRLDGDVRRAWSGLALTAADAPIGTAFTAKFSGQLETFAQTYDLEPFRGHGAAKLRVRMVRPDEPLAPLPD